MRIQDYQYHLASLSFGKRLPNAVYVYWNDGANVGDALKEIVKLAALQAVEAVFNIIKFRTDELKISFLHYPDFMEIAHPALRDATTVDLVTRRSRRTTYTGNHNPPILHRKETLLPASHPRYQEFASLTRSEEAAGLYVETATIGFKLNWERQLAAKSLRITGHTLERLEISGSIAESATSSLSVTAIHDHSAIMRDTVAVERHKTALTRYELSKPVKTLLEYGMLKFEMTFFDYGCGQGSDVRGLQALGYQAEGWDPVHRSNVAKREADVVNFGYVLNVVEDPAERLEALVDAHRYCKKLLVVSALIKETVDVTKAKHFSDGVLTRANTFQKFFQQQELEQYVEDALDASAVPVALGVFYVFRNPADQQDFLSARNRRAIDWMQISDRLGLGGPKNLWSALYEQNKQLLDAFGEVAFRLGRMPSVAEFSGLVDVNERLGSEKRALRAFVQGGGSSGVEWDDVKARFGIGQPTRKRWEIICEENRELLDTYWRRVLELGRPPAPEEFAAFADLRARVGSGKRAVRLFWLRGGREEFLKAAEGRRRDLLVYVALANLRRRVPFGHLSQTLRWDIRHFFGNYTRALEKGLELLYAAGDAGEIELACEDVKVGWQDEQALYVHRGLLMELPPILRAYVGCATALFGDVAQADVVKLHKASGKVTFLVYDDFESKSLPELKLRIKVNLRTRWVQVFDHSSEGQLLYFKERFVAPGHPAREKMEKFGARLRRLGFDERSSMMKTDFVALLASKGLNQQLNRCAAGRITGATKTPK